MEQRTVVAVTMSAVAAIGALVLLYAFWTPLQLAPDELALKSSLLKPPPPPPWYGRISDPLRGRMRRPWHPQNVPEIIPAAWNWGDRTAPVCCVPATAIPNHVAVFGWRVVRVANADKWLIHRVAPNYPEEARTAKVQGIVKLDVVLGEDGKPLLIAVLGGSRMLGQAALTAVQQWQYKPLLVNGKAQKVHTTINVDFKL